MTIAFDDLQLDPKLLQALRKKGFATPTHVQATCIPEALLGKDLVAQARTGTGKTLAYVLPALHRILAGSQGLAGWQALILVPTRELCEQASPIHRISSLKDAAYCGWSLAITITHACVAHECTAQYLMHAASMMDTRSNDLYAPSPCMAPRSCMRITLATTPALV